MLASYDAEREIAPLLGGRARRPSLEFTCTVPLKFPRGSASFFSGPNGAGKSTFLERVLVPHIERESAVFAWGADTGRAELALRMVLGVNAVLSRKPPADLHVRANLLRTAMDTFDAFQPGGVIVLDESEPEVTDFLALDDSGRLQQLHWCIVRHNCERDEAALSARGIRVHNYQFERRKNKVTIEPRSI